MEYLDQISHIYLFQYFPGTGMQNVDKGLPSITLAGRCLLVKMLINIEPHVIF